MSQNEKSSIDLPGLSLSSLQSLDKPSERSENLTGRGESLLSSIQSLINEVDLAESRASKIVDNID